MANQKDHADRCFGAQLVSLKKMIAVQIDRCSECHAPLARIEVNSDARFIAEGGVTAEYRLRR